MNDNLVFLFSWDCYGIESIVLLNDIEETRAENTVRKLKGEDRLKHCRTSATCDMVLMRARANPHRFYEVYVVACEPSLDEDFWENQWATNPQGTADLVRSRGEKLFCSRQAGKVVIS